MVRPAAVLHGILNELESRQPHCIEREVICSAGVSNAERGHSEIPEWLHPGLKYRRHCFVALQVNTSNRTRTVVHVEISGELRVVGLQLHILALREMLGDVGARAEDALLFAGPETQSDRPAHFESGR